MAAARAILAVCVAALVLGGCLGPTVLHQQVLGYDEVTRKLEEKLLRWRQKPNGHYELTRLTVGRVVVKNVDPMGLTDAQQFEQPQADPPAAITFASFRIDLRADGAKPLSHR